MFDASSVDSLSAARVRLALASCVLFTCGALSCTSDGRTGNGGPPSTGVGVDDGEDMADGIGDDTLDDDGEVRLDAMGDGGPSTGEDEGISPSGCQAVDFLFVIDNSGSMGDNQQNLVNSFPGFISTIQDAVVEAQDFHVMVAKTDNGWGTSDLCEQECLILGSCVSNPNYDCQNPPQPPTSCDAVMGAGVTYPTGSDSSNMLCNLASGSRYITPATQDLGQAFTCIASVGTDGSADERQVESMIAALSPQLNNAGGCNEGFLRDEAILVVTMITDEDDVNSPGTPPGWVQSVLSAKSGDGSGIVMIGLLSDSDQPSPQCAASAGSAPRLGEFIGGFENSYRGSVCAANYAQVLADAVSIIDTACEEYVPPAG